MKKLILSIFITLILFACGTISTQTWKKEFQRENLPVRELRVVAVLDEDSRDYKAMVSWASELVERASDLLKEQVGIALKIVRWEQIKWKNRDWYSEGGKGIKMMRQLQEQLWPDLYSKTDFDIAIAFPGRTLEEENQMQRLPKGKLISLGMTDGAFKRFIILRFDAYTLVHEVFHCFLFSKVHEEKGIMKAKESIYLYLTPESRQEVLRNKWRSFDERP